MLSRQTMQGSEVQWSFKKLGFFKNECCTCHVGIPKGSVWLWLGWHHHNRHWLGALWPNNDTRVHLSIHPPARMEIRARLQVVFVLFFKRMWMYDDRRWVCDANEACAEDKECILIKTYMIFGGRQLFCCKRIQQYDSEQHNHHHSALRMTQHVGIKTQDYPGSYYYCISISSIKSSTLPIKKGEVVLFFRRGQTLQRSWSL